MSLIDLAREKKRDIQALKPELLLQQMRMAKGGVIGVGDKGVIAIRFDDWQDDFRTNIYPLLVARGLPASMALISEFQTAQPWGVGTTWDDIRTWNRNGLEIWCHGRDHNDYEGYTGLYANIVSAKETIEAQQIKVQGFALPGVTPVYNANPYNGLTSISDYYSDEGRLLLQTYALTEAYSLGAYRQLPNGMYHGLDHITVSDGLSLEVSKTHIDAAVKRKIGVEIMCHSGNLGTAGCMTLADFTALLDYIVAYRDAGELEVLTPSGLMFADKSNQRLDLIADGSFEGVATVSPGSWSALLAGQTIESSGGRTGSNFVRIANTTTQSVKQYVELLQTRGLGGETFVFEGWFRSNGASTTTGRVILQDYNDTTRLNLSPSKVSNGTEWTLMRFAFSLHPLTNRLTIAVGRTGGDGVDWDDISVKKV